MKSFFSKFTHAIAKAATAKEIRPYEVAIVRFVIAAVLAQYGIKHF